MQTLTNKNISYPKIIKNFREEYSVDFELSNDFDFFDSKKALEEFLNFFNEEKIIEITKLFAEGYIEEEQQMEEEPDLFDPNRLNDSMTEFLYDPIERYIKHFLPNERLIAYAFFGKTFTEEDTKKEVVQSALRHLKEFFDYDELFLFSAKNFVDLSQDVLFNDNYPMEKRKNDLFRLARVMKEETIEFSLDQVYNTFD